MLLWGLLWDGPQFKEQISKEGRCFVGKYAHVGKVELGAGQEERTAEKQVFCAGK